MSKYLLTLVGFLLALAFVVLFFTGRTETKQLTEIAPRVGLSHTALLEMGPRIASSSGATLGTARHVVYLLACSGRATATTLELQATRASSLAFQKRLTDREAVVSVLAQADSTVSRENLKGC
jgi:hypothetical protein